MKTIELKVEVTVEQAAAFYRGETVAITKPKKVWEPKGGRAYIDVNGVIEQAPSSQMARMFGLEREKREQAVHDLPAITLAHLLINYRAEVAPMWKVEPDGGGIFYSVYCLDGDWCVNQTIAPDIGAVCFPEREAEILADKLNCGEVVF